MSGFEINITTATGVTKKVIPQRFYDAARAAKDTQDFFTKVKGEDKNELDELLNACGGADEFMKHCNAEKTNAKNYPKKFYFRHMVQGVAQYHNERLYLKTDTIKNMASSFVGKPIYVDHQQVDLENIHNADGFVTGSFYNELDGWMWGEGIAISDAGQQAIKNGWKVSNAYLPKEWKPKGQYLGVDYDREITNAEFTHLAIVPVPRYEEAAIFTPEAFHAYQNDKRSKLAELRNSKTEHKGNTIMSIAEKIGKIFKTEEVEVTNSIPADADLSQYLVEVNGEKIPLSEVINKVTATTAKKVEEEEKLNEATEVTVGDKKMPLKDLLAEFITIQTAEKKNADDKAAKEKADKDAADALEKKNAAEGTKNFNEIANAAAAAKQEVKTVVVDLPSDQLARGRERY